MNKTVVSLILFLTIIAHSIDAKTIKKPSYKYRTHPTHTVLSVDRNAKSTVLEIETKLYPGWWIEIGETAQLVDADSGESYPVTGSKGISLGVKMHLPKEGKMVYQLTFPALKKTTQEIHFFPFGDQGACRTYGLRLDGKSAIHTGQAMLDKIQGNWFTSDGSGAWTLGVKGDFVIWKSNFWKGKVDQNTQHLILTHRENPSMQDTLALKLNKKGSLTIDQSDAKSLTLQNERVRSASAPRSLEDDTSWSETEMLTSGKAVVRGIIHGYHPSMDWTKGQITVNNALYQDEDVFGVNVQSDGTFQSEIEVPYPSEVIITLNNRKFRFLVAANDTMVLSIEYDDLSRSINGILKRGQGTLYMGNHAQTNSEINQHYVETPFESLQPHYRSKGYKEFEKWYDQEQKSKIAQLEEYIARVNPNRKTVDYLRLNLALEHTYYKFIYPDQREYHLNSDTSITDRDLNIPLEFFQIKDESVKNNPRLITIRDSYFLANELAFFEDVRNALMLDLDTLEKYTSTPFSKEVRAVADSLKQNKLVITKENALQYLPYALLLRDGTPETQEWNNWIKVKQINQVLDQSLNIPRGSFLSDMIKVKLVHNMIDTLQSASQMARIISEFTHPLAIQYLIEINEKHRPKSAPLTPLQPATPATTTEQTTKTKSSDAESILAQLLAPYRGKIVYLDFWAMWCGPCRSGMKNSYRVKDLMRAHTDVVFAYLSTERDSPKSTREEFISKNEIKGEFLYATVDEWTQLTTHFNIAGIPRYMIVGRDGKVIDPECRMDEQQLVKKLKELSAK